MALQPIRVYTGTEWRYVGDPRTKDKANKTKDIEGGQFLAPVRVPTLTVAKSWPNPRTPWSSVLWAEDNGQTLYGIGTDATMRKSTDGGETWTTGAYLNWGPAAQGIFLKTQAGTLITAGAWGGWHLRRSTDDGATWTNVLTLRTPLLGSQSICEDLTTGYLYCAEYGSEGGTTNVLQSVDEGATWTVLHAFPTVDGNPDRILHLHAVQWDHVAQRVVISAGDSTPATGLYRVNATSDGVEPVVLNRDLPAEFYDAPRSIGIMPFPDYLAWASDSTANPYLFRIARDQIGQASPTVERVYRLNSTAWWTCRASDDGTRWVFSASQENESTQLDKLAHLYAVEDQGATVYEVGALAPTTDTSPASSLMPVGMAEGHGETFFMQTRGAGSSATWKFRLGQAGGTAIPWPESRPETPSLKTFNSGPVALAAGETKLFAVDIAPTLAPKMYIHDYQVRAEEGFGLARIDLAEAGQPFFLRGSGTSARYTAHGEYGGAIHVQTLTAGTMVHFIVANTSAQAITAMAACTFGWGR